MRLPDLDRYDFSLPQELIRRTPLEPRDTSRLFVYDTRRDEVRLGVFRDITQFLPSVSLIVMNNTRVLPARLWLTKETGGKIEVLVLVNEMSDDTIPLIVDRKIRKGQKLFFPSQAYLEIVNQDERIFLARLHGADSITSLLEHYGETPLPHYLESDTRLPEALLRKRYQTLFAATGQSVAAPTAGLHFTDEVFRTLRARGIDRADITLNVGLGTFAPLTEDNFASKTLHREWVDIPPGMVDAVNLAKRSGAGIVAVGTTVTRALESQTHAGLLRAYSGPVDLFITPPHTFQAIDALVTNFHLPRSSLLLLVEAFLQHKQAKQSILDLYHRAIDERYSFYSFGDSMLIL